MPQLEKGAQSPPILETSHPKDMKKGIAMRSLYANKSPISFPNQAFVSFG